MTRLLFVACETGGLDPRVHSLLSVAMVVWEDGQLGAEIEVPIVHDPYVVGAGALRVNGIDLTRKGATPITAREEIASFVDKHFGDPPGWIAQNVIPAGHNMAAFDLPFLRQFLGNEGFVRFHHRCVDTLPLLLAVHHAGLLPSLGELTEACAYFGIENPARHTALGDARATAQLYTALLALLQEGKQLRMGTPRYCCALGQVTLHDAAEAKLPPDIGGTPGPPFASPRHWPKEQQ